MSFEFRRAIPDDAPGIAQVKRVIWHDVTANPDYIARVIQQSDHTTQVAVDTATGQIAGFVDGFVTVSQRGHQRWECDLLAVHPDQRGQGLARQLIALNTSAAAERGLSVARSLIEVDNKASQRAFMYNGYVQRGDTCDLMVDTAAQSATHYTAPTTGWLMMVCTFNYAGIWLEGDITSASISAAQHMRQRYRCDLVGMLIPHTDTDALNLVRDLSFESIGTYQWWLCDLHNRVG